MSRTYVLMAVPQALYANVKAQLLDAGYTQAIHEDQRRECLDMHGIALQVEAHELHGCVCAVCDQPIQQALVWQCGCEGEQMACTAYDEGQYPPPSWVERKAEG